MPGANYSVHAAVPYVQGHATAMAAAQKAAQKTAEAEGSTGFGFGDLLDIVNPLQHIPGVSTLYRHLTGDKISTPAKVVGDTVYGGLTGMIASLSDSLFEAVTGKTVGDTVYAYLFEDSDSTTAIAANDNAPAAPVTPEPASATTLPQISMPEISTGDFTIPGFGLFDSPAPASKSPSGAAEAYRANGRLLEAY